MPHRRHLSDTRQKETKVSNFGQLSGDSARESRAVQKTDPMNLFLKDCPAGDLRFMSSGIVSHGI